MTMDTIVYVSPQCEEMELALEGAVLANSIPDFEDGGDLIQPTQFGW